MRRLAYVLCLAMVGAFCAGCGGEENMTTLTPEAVEFESNAEAESGCSCFFSEGTIVVKDSGESGTVWQEIPIKYDAYQAYLSMSDESHGSILYCSSPAAGLMNKILYQTEDGWASYTETDISLQIDGYPNSLTMKSSQTGYIGIEQRNDSYLYYTEDAGQTWEPLVVDERVENCNGYAPVFDETGENAWLILDRKEDGNSYSLYRSSDGGGSWVAQGVFSLPTAVSRIMLKDGVLYVANGQGKWYRIL